MANQNSFTVEVAFAKPEKQVIIPLQVDDETTVGQAIEASDIISKFPEIDLVNAEVGIFGKVCKLDRIMKPGERVEIYRPLLLDPKEHRRQKTTKGKKIQVDDAVD